MDPVEALINYHVQYISPGMEIQRKMNVKFANAWDNPVNNLPKAK